MAKSKARHTVHGGRRHPNRNILTGRRHKRHCPRLFTTCSRSTITAIAKSRTVSSVSTSGSTGSSPLSFFTHCSSCSVHSRCFISPRLSPPSQPLLTTQHVHHGIAPPPPDGVPVVTVTIKKHPPDRRCFRYGSTPAAELRLLNPSIVGVPVYTSVFVLHVFSACLCGGLVRRGHPGPGTTGQVEAGGGSPARESTSSACNPTLGLRHESRRLSR
jgi:hypothetical protein